MIAAWFCLACLGVAGSGLAETRPNIVFILADDLGWTDLGCQGSKYYETPAIDRLAREGMRFTDAYSCGPNCQPTRAAIMSGQYGPRTGVYTVGGTDRFDTSRRPLRPVENVVQLPLSAPALPEFLSRAGYHTGHFGKWHLGTGQFGPDRRGFAEALVSMGRHFDFATIPPVDVPQGTYLADYLTDRALDFLDRNKDKRFFLYLPHFGVHSPFQAKSEWIDRFKGKPASGGHADPTYAAMIASVDESVGRVMSKLRDLGLDDKTIVLFSSDNGGVGGYREAGIDTAQGITLNAPLRGGKGMLYEGGIRVPLIVRWPGVVRPGTISAEPVVSVDLMPTFLRLAGAAPPEGQPLDGVSIVPILRSDGGAKLDRDALYWHFPGYLGAGGDAWRTTPVGAIRMREFKLLEFFEDGRIELYHLADDVGEKRNLAAEMPERAKRMHEKLIEWRKSIGAPMPTKRTPNDPPDDRPAKKKKRAKRAAHAVSGHPAADAVIREA